MRDYTQTELDMLYLHYCTEQNARVYAHVLANFANVAEAREAAKQKSAAAFSFVSEGVRARLFENAQPGAVERSVEHFAGAGIRALFLSEDASGAYPALLREIFDPPAVLFALGTLPPEAQLPVAIVGSRAATRYGRDMAKLFGFGLAEKGACVVSGLALGADACASKGALECKTAETPTVAVLGCGVDVVYPLDNRALYQEIAGRGALVSEYWPGTRPRREHFPARNRIISGLSRGLLVVEAAEKSGTFITVNCAHEQGRDVFALPGRVTDPMSRGTNRLIQQGEAKPCFCVEDILCEYTHITASGTTAANRRTVRISELEDMERAVARVLLKGETDFDALSAALPYPAGALSACLTSMIFSGYIVQLPGRVYALNEAECCFAGE